MAFVGQGASIASSLTADFTRVDNRIFYNNDANCQQLTANG
jgi:hypothetical protein